MPFKRSPGCNCCIQGRCGIRCKHALNNFTSNIAHIYTPYWGANTQYDNTYLNNSSFFLISEGYDEEEDACIFRRDTSRWDETAGPVDLSIVLYIKESELRVEIIRDGEKFCWVLITTDPQDMSYNTRHELDPEVGTDCLEFDWKYESQGDTISLAFVCRECLFSQYGFPAYQHAPGVIPVTMSGWTNDQGQECGNLNGTFLTQFSSINYCGWYGMWTYDWGYISIRIQGLEWWTEYSPAQWRVDVNIAEYNPTDDSFDKHLLDYRKDYPDDVAAPDLDGHEVIPFYHSGGSPGDLCNYPTSIEIN